MNLRKMLVRKRVPANLKTGLKRFNSGNDKKLAELKEAKEINKKNLAEIASLKNQNSEKDKFFSIIAHDLRGPLSSFLGLSECLMEDVQSMSIKDLQSLAESMHGSAKKLFALLENLLIWSKSRMGATQPVMQPVLLLTLMDKVESMYRAAADKKGLSIEKIDGDLMINCDDYLVETVLRNLIGNAVKFCNQGDKITISAEQFEHEVLVSVMDTGIGMSEEIVQGLFRLDSKVQQIGTAGEPSTGLGLLLCKEFVELHGGRIWAESEKGFGSAFHFTIPSPEQAVPEQTNQPG
ncbi:MAG: sensor histidine kinase [Patescibacteria group bacterium]